MFHLIQAYLEELRGLLCVSPEEEERILLETTDHLYEGVWREQARGCSLEEAERRAIERFGPAETIAREFNEDAAEGAKDAASYPEEPEARTKAEGRIPEPQTGKEGTMQEKLTERTLRAISFAQMEAVRRRKNAVGPEHLLLGLLRDKGCAACRILERYTGIRAEDLERVARKPMPVRTPTETAARETLKQGKDMPLNPNGKWVMDVAYEEAQRLGNNYVGTEHLLLGILQSDECILLQVLNREFVLMLEEARSVIIHHLRNSKDPKKEVTVIRFLTSDGPMSLPLNAVKEMTVKTKNGDYTGRFMEVATEQATPPKPPQMPPADNTVQDDPPFPPGLGI